MALNEHTEAIIEALHAEGMAATARIGSSDVKGFLFRGHREIGAGEEILVGLELSFDCFYADAANLQEGDEILFGAQRYRFVRHIPEGGDESGWVTCELGSFK